MNTPLHLTALREVFFLSFDGEGRTEHKCDEETGICRIDHSDPSGED